MHLSGSPCTSKSKAVDKQRRQRTEQQRREKEAEAHRERDWQQQGGRTKHFNLQKSSPPSTHICFCSDIHFAHCTQLLYYNARDTLRLAIETKANCDRTEMQ